MTNLYSILKYELINGGIPYAKKDVERIEKFAQKHGFAGKDGSRASLQGWDFAYWSERLRKSRYNLSDEETKPFFRLENVQQSLFDLAGRLYGIRFVEAKDIPVYHKDVKVYDVLDKDGSHLALFYSDFYPRESKRGGAWMTSFRDSGGIPEQRPLISIVCNFTKPTPTKPSLPSLAARRRYWSRDRDISLMAFRRCVSNHSSRASFNQPSFISCSSAT